MITKQRYFQKLTYDNIFNNLSEKKNHALSNNIRFRSIAMPKIACGLDKKCWDEVSKTIVDVFQHSGNTIFVYASGQEIKEMPALEVFDTGNVSSKFEQIGSDIVKFFSPNRRMNMFRFQNETKT